jgi:outer membrane receptor protein involved in Fe transport
MRIIRIVVTFCLVGGVAVAAQGQEFASKAVDRHLLSQPLKPVVPLGEALAMLEKAYDVHIVYDDAVVRGRTTARLASAAAGFQEALEMVLGEAPITYKKVGARTVVLQPAEPPEPMPVLQTTGTIKGRVTTEQGEGIHLAQVLIEGTTLGDAADQNGDYEIAAPPGTYTLRTKVIGYRDQSAKVTVVVGETVTQDFSLSEDPLLLGEIVTTGTRTPRLKLETPLAISSLSARQVAQAAPRSTTEVLRYVPGFTRVESSGGEVNQNISLRGIYGVELVNFMEDGLPVFPTMHTFFMNADNLFRPDENIETVEVVRGGNSALYGSNAPAAIINFINKTGGPVLNGVTKGTVGTAGLARYDFNLNGPLGNNWRFNVGGFYRFDRGVRDPGFPGIRGGQIKGNITRLLDNGYFRVSAKRIDDRNQFILPLPFRNPSDPEYVPGFSNFGAMNTLEGNDLRIPLPLENGELTLPLDDGIRTDAYWLTGDISFDFPGDWNLQNTAQIMQNKQSWNAILPFDVIQANDWAQGQLDGLIAAGTVPANSRFRLFFTNHFDAAGNKLPFNTANGLIAPGGEWHVEKPISHFQNQIQVNKGIQNHTLTLGSYFGYYTQKNTWFFTDILTDVRDNPRFVDMVVTDPAGNTILEVTKNGFRNFLSNYANGSGHTTIFSFFGSLELKPMDKLRVDVGARFEHDNFVQVSENTSRFDLDGDPTTSYDNEVWGNQTFRQFDFSFDEWALSAGINYQLSNQLAVFGQAARGYKMPALDEYLFPAVAQAALFEPRHTLTFEGGVKYSSPLFGASVNGFWGELKDITTQGAEVDPVTGGTVWSIIEQDKTRSWGAEVEVSARPVPELSLMGNGTFLKAELGSGADLGSILAGVPPVIGNLSATYTKSGFTVLADWHYVGRRFLETQVEGAARDKLKAYSYLNLGASYKIPRQPITLSANLLNVYQSKGLEEGNPRLRQVGGRTSDLFLARPILPRRFTFTVGYQF